MRLKEEKSPHPLPTLNFIPCMLMEIRNSSPASPNLTSQYSYYGSFILHLMPFIAFGLEREFKIKTNCPQKSQIEGGLSCLEARPSRTFLDENVFCLLQDTAFINNFPYLSLILCFQGTISRMLVACDLCWGFRINMQMAHCSGATRGHLGGTS